MKKIPVAVLGATGRVGQKFIKLLANHPWFEIKELCASEKSAGKKYIAVVDWCERSQIPINAREINVQKCVPNLNSKVVFSGLDSSVAGKIETDFARAGYTVISNSSNHRMDKRVPLIIPEVNPEHLRLLKNRRKGCILTNPNCSTIGLVLALKSLDDEFRIRAVNVTTLQAVSGAGQSRVVKLAVRDNVLPYIKGEEEKLETEPMKILGRLNKKTIKPAKLIISAQCNRVNVSDGHTEIVQVKLRKKTTMKRIIKVWKEFKGEPQYLKLPSAPRLPIHYSNEINFPQPKYQRNVDKGMAVSIGRLRKDALFDFKFVIVSHNTIRGAAGGAILCAELMKAKGYI